MDKRLPLIVILGATGSGKTKLSLELAQRFKGEIIGADSMQIYKGLDIITAKAKPEELNLVPHHLINILEPYEVCSVQEYQERALKIIDNLFNKHKLPIIVGGTNYYIESLLWKVLIPTAADAKMKLAANLKIQKEFELPSEQLHEKLKLLDPMMARRLHPNNKRKILRSLEVLYQTGKQHSFLLKEQQSSKGGSQLGGGLRYTNALIFQLQCEQTILDERLNKRVDSMISEGLVEELLQFHRSYNNNRVPDYTKGVFQSIGFKEFHPYLMLKEEERTTEDGKKIFEKCLDELKMVTRRYARKQNKWARNRFLGREDRQVPPMYGLDTSDVLCWIEKVLSPAIEIIDSYMLDKECCHKPLPRVPCVNPDSNSNDDTHICEVCNRLFVGNHQYNSHLISRRHKKMLEKKNKLLKEESKNN